MAHDYQLPLMDRDDAPRRKVIDGKVESNGEYVRRLAIEQHGMDPGGDQPEPRRPWRRWMNEKPFEERMEELFAQGPREPGEEG